MNAATNIGVDLARAVRAARVLRQAVPILGSPEDDAAGVTQSATRIEEEATSTNSDPSHLQRWRNQGGGHPVPRRSSAER